MHLQHLSFCPESRTSREASSTSWQYHSLTLPHRVGRWQVHHRTAKPHLYGGGFSHEDHRLQLFPLVSRFHQVMDKLSCRASPSAAIQIQLPRKSRLFQWQSPPWLPVTADAARRDKFWHRPRSREWEISVCPEPDRDGYSDGKGFAASGSDRIFFLRQGPCHLCIKWHIYSAVQEEIIITVASSLQLFQSVLKERAKKDQSKPRFHKNLWTGF